MYMSASNWQPSQNGMERLLALAVANDRDTDSYWIKRVAAAREFFALSPAVSQLLAKHRLFTELNINLLSVYFEG